MKSFVDTNILIYAYDRGAGQRHQLARDQLKHLWTTRTGVLSVQVLQEFYVNVRRKAQHSISFQDARTLVENYLAWNPVVNDAELLLNAIKTESRYRLSFWDAMIVAAAERSGAEVLLTEDFNHGQAYGSVIAKNPFRSG